MRIRETHTRILTVDDHPSVIHSMGMVLEKEKGKPSVAGYAEDGSEAVEKCMELKPSLVLMDANMPKLSGVDATKRIRRFNSAVKILFYSGFEGAAEPALAAGAQGFVLKASPIKSLLLAIDVVLSGGVYLDEQQWRAIQPRLLRTGPSLSGLSPEERTIGRLVVEGLTSKEIGEKMNVSPRWVEKRRAQLMEKMGVRNVAGLVGQLAASFPSETGY